MERVEENSIPSREKGWGAKAYRQVFASTIKEILGLGPKCGYVTVRIYGTRENPVYEVFIKHLGEKVEHFSGLKSLDLKALIENNCPRAKRDHRLCDRKCVENCSIQIYDYILLRELEDSIGPRNPVF
jgi:hypothetical protein